MYRRLVLFGLSVVAVAVVALVIPLGLAARDLVRAEELGELQDHARRTAAAWESAWRHDADTAQVPIPAGDGEVTLLLPSGQVVGPAPAAAAAPVVEAARDGQSATLDADAEAFASAPAALDDETGIVLVSASADLLREGLMPRLMSLAAVSAALLAFAAVAAWWLARRTVRPIERLARTADAIADGDLGARVPSSSIPDVHEVGTAMNRMAARVSELLDDERAGAAELAHQLRTPLTVLTVDLDLVQDAEVRARLREDALALQRTTDEIITAARRPAREGLRARCDAAAAVAERAQFWHVLAEDQHRTGSTETAPGPLWVRLTADDLTALVDILLQNVFIHTPEGVPYEVGVAPAGDGAVRLTVRDHGPGFATTGASAPGTTGLGLSIARRLAEASGGDLRTENCSDGGARVTVELGPATD